MKNKLLASSICALFVLFLHTTLAATSHAADGILACLGPNSLVSGGTEGNQNFGTVSIVNFNDTATVEIERIMVYSNHGELVCDFPNEDYSLRPGFKYILQPHERTTMTTLHMNYAGCLDPPSPAAGGGIVSVSMLIYWSYLEKGEKIPLHATYTETVRDLNEGFNHIARGLNDCKEIQLSSK